MNRAYLNWPELRKLWTIALPLVIAYVAEYLMFLTSKLIIGKLGYQELGAIGLAGDLSMELTIILMGLLSVVGVLIAEAEGAGRKQDGAHAARQGLIVATGLGIIASGFVWHLPVLLQWTGQDPVVVELSTPFVHALAPFVLPVLWFAVLRTFVTALSSTSIIMLVTFFGVVLNYGLSQALVHGQFGLPKLGIAGAGLALNLTHWIMFGLLALYVALNARFREYALFKPFIRIDYVVFREIFRLGLPVAGLVSLEAGLFIAVSILSGVIGTDSLAAYQVLMSWVAIPFMISLGVANATMVRVAHGVGLRDARASFVSGITGISSGVCVIIALVAVPLMMPGLFVGWFLRPDDPGFERVSTLVSELLIIVVFFQVFDGLQVISSHALRGLRDTLVPLLLAAAGYWVIGIAGGSYLTFGLDLGVYGLWLGLAGGLTVTGTLLTRRFYQLAGKSHDDVP